MEMWHHRPVRCHRRNSPSFSSSLLDAIYRSIDAESDSTGNLTGGAPDIAAKMPRALPVSESPVTALNYYYYSSSDADSAGIARPRPKPDLPGPVLTRYDSIRSDPPPPNPTNNSISIKKKLRDLKKSTSPSSPGARLAGFLNSLFAPSNHKKTKISTAESPSPSPSPSSASSYSRSCLSKTPSTNRSTGSSGSKRAVRFSPVGVIVDEDCRPCGEKFLFDRKAEPPPATADRRRRKMVEELMKGFEMETVSGDDSDDGSEDLFELENLVGINGGGGRGFSDELPVYGTTDLGINCAIAKGLV